MILAADPEPRPEWESGRVAEPMDYPSIVFAKLAQLLESPIGGKERHRHLQDIASVLAPYLDDQYGKDLEEAGQKRDRIRTGQYDGVNVSEAIEAHQLLWLTAIMRCMKRHNLLGEEWVRG